jgi:hypothetical protein
MSCLAPGEKRESAGINDGHVTTLCPNCDNEMKGRASFEGTAFNGAMNLLQDIAQSAD